MDIENNINNTNDIETVKNIPKSVFVVVCNGKVSNEGYSTEEKAIDFIKHRYGKPKQDISQGWIWFDKDGFEYKIKEINIR